MICPYCGRLNTKDGEACVQCGRPLAPPAAEACAEHPDRDAVARCSQCDRLLCDECNTPVGGSPYCIEHANALLVAGTAGGLLDTPVVDTATRRAAYFGQRVQSGLIDLAVYAVFLLIVYLLFGAFTGLSPADPDAGGWRVVFWLLVVLVPFAYLTLETASGGRTLGKSASDLIALREDGRIMDLQTAALRAALSMAGFLLGGIGFWAILWDPRRRALHDRWTGAIVIQD